MKRWKGFADVSVVEAQSVEWVTGGEVEWSGVVDGGE
jgi:hypothetical protein